MIRPQLRPFIEKRKTLIFIAAVAFISISVTQLIVRLSLPPPGFTPIAPQNLAGLITPHAARDYAYAAGFVGKINTWEYHTDMAINSIGLRDDEIGPDEKIDIVAAGNSFTVGYGVQAEESWPSRLESYVNETLSPDSIRVVNAGVSGYSLRQIRLHIEDLLYLEPDIIVLGLYPGGHDRMNNPYIYFGGSLISNDRVPHLRFVGEGYLYSPFRNKILQRIHYWTMEHFEAAAYLAGWVGALTGGPARSNIAKGTSALAAGGGLSSLLNELGAITQLVRRRGIELVVLLVTPQDEDGSFSSSEEKYNAIIRSYCRNAEITLFDPLPYFESSALDGTAFRIGRDAHWSRQAHALVGRRLGDFLLQRRLLQSSAEKAATADGSFAER